ncbi:DUF2892 domain-containing protein [bacterium LRH843]|nr:DUF2892 domain-containing protein [bacterium LRH843]
MKPNIGRLDAYCRITMGLTILACSTAKLVRRPTATMPMLGAMMGGMKVAEGITRFCPLTCLAEACLKEKTYGNMINNDSSEENMQRESTINPS